MGHCWAEVLQQIRHQSVDLLLICLGESSIHKEVRKALKALGDLPFNLPPILVLDQRLNLHRNKFPSLNMFTVIKEKNWIRVYRNCCKCDRYPNITSFNINGRPIKSD